MEKTIVITSGTSDIGSAIIKKIVLETEIDRIIINYGHDEHKVEKMISKYPSDIRDKMTFVKADMSNEKGLNIFIDKIFKITNKIDWLILNTGISTYEKFDNYTIETWNTIMNTNVTIPIFLIQKIKPLLNKNGSILFMSSYTSILPYSSSVVYGTSKAAISFLAKTLVKEFEQNSIRVNAIAPGFIETKWQENRSSESREKINNKIALHRFGNPEEVASLCYEVLSNGYINGSIYEIHGGYNYY